MTRFDDDDRAFMARALALAERGLYTTTPNPRVGCVIVRDGRIVGEGWHQRAGGPHAEVAALADTLARGVDARGATVGALGLSARRSWFVSANVTEVTTPAVDAVTL